MLATPWAAPFSSPAWAFELKYDGFRLRAAKVDGRVLLLYRGGSEVTARYPELVEAISALPGRDFLLDGELVVYDASGRPDFEALQARAFKRQVARSAGLRFVVFDVLAHGGRDLRTLPFRARRAFLEKQVPASGLLERAIHVVGDGEAFFASVRTLALEGMVAKRLDSPYVHERSRDWRKICVRQEAVFRVVGVARDASALHIADCRAGLPYAGRVELGRFQRQLQQNWSSLMRLRRPDGGERGSPSSSTIWLEPELACRVRFKQRTASGKLRDAYFLGWT